jgi:hypothetical protein
VSQDDSLDINMSSGTATPVAAGSKESANGVPAIGSSTVAPTPLKPLDKSGHYGNFSPEQEKLLAEFERKLQGAGALPNPALKDEEQRVTVLG